MKMTNKKLKHSNSPYPSKENPQTDIVGWKPNNRQKRLLKKNQDGVIMVIALFGGLFLVAILYHIIGVGHSTLENQLMQDAADSITWSAATVKARGMNTIALFNLIMALVLAVLVAIRLLQMIIGVAIAAIGVACAFSFGAACTAAEPLIQLEVNLNKIAKQVKPEIKEILTGLEKASDVIVKGTSFLAEAEAVYISRKESKGVSSVGFVWPVAEKLPVEPGKFADLCNQAGHQVVQVSTFFLPDGVSKKADSTVGKLIGEMAGSFSKFFCGNGGKPSIDSKHEVAYPIKENTKCAGSTAKISLTKHKCTSDQCKECLEDACTMCIARFNRKGFKKARWLITTERWEETTDKNGHVITGKKTERDSVKWIDDDPCEAKAKCGEDAICETVTKEPVFGNSSKLIVTRIIYKAIESCIVKESIKTGKAPEALNTSSWPVHKVIKKNAKNADFNLIGLGAGKNRADNRLKNIGLLIKQKKNAAIDRRIGFAKAQFTSPNPDMWHMDWYSRLIRFRLDKQSKGFGCKGNSGKSCSKLGKISGKIGKFQKGMILH